MGSNRERDAPALMGRFDPYGGESISADLGGLIGTRDALAALSFHTEVAALLAWALKNAAIDEGSYPIDRDVRDGMTESLGRIVSHLPPDHVARVLDGFPFLRSDAPFILKREHIQLLRHLRFEWPSDAMIALMQARGWAPVATVNFKRPCGDMSAYALDMEQSLALPPPADATARQEWLGNLYRELWPALQMLSRTRICALRSHGRAISHAWASRLHTHFSPSLLFPSAAAAPRKRHREAYSRAGEACNSGQRRDG